jgi:hypothetical protein
MPLVNLTLLPGLRLQVLGKLLLLDAWFPRSDSGGGQYGCEELQ